MSLQMLMALFDDVGVVGDNYTLADLASSYDDLDTPTQTYSVQIVFQTDGTVDVNRGIAANLPEEQVDYTDGSTADCWMRCHYVSGTTMTSGSALETWHQCSTGRSFTLQYTSSGPADSVSGVFDFELSSDSSGSPVEASKQITFNVGEL